MFTTIVSGIGAGWALLNCVFQYSEGNRQAAGGWLNACLWAICVLIGSFS